MRPIALMAAILCLAAALPAPGQGSQDLIPAGSWIFEALESVFLDAGIVPPPIVAPMPRSELASHLGCVDPSILSQAGRAAFALLGREAGRKAATEGYLLTDEVSAGGLRLRSAFSAALELRGRSDGSISWNEAAQDRPSLLGLEFAFDLGDGASGCAATAYALMELREEYWASTLGAEELGAFNWNNLPEDPDYIDPHIPRRAGLSFGGLHWNAALGRDFLDMGAARLGALTVSRWMDRSDFARLSFHSPTFAWRSLVVQLTPVPTDETESAANAISRYLYLHRADWRPFPWFSIGFSEGVLVAQSLELRYLNPLMMYHGFAAWRDYGDVDHAVGSLLGLETAVTPLRGLRAYGRLALNQFQLPYERQNWPTFLPPDAYALLGGAEYKKGLGPGFLSAGIELYYSTPWFATNYGRDWSFITSRRELVAPYPYPYKDILTWLGSPYGRDSRVLDLRLAWTATESWSLELGFRRAEYGENALDSSWTWSAWYENPVLVPYSYRDRTPSGVPMIDSSLGVGGSWKVWRLRLEAEIAGRWIENEGHAEGADRSGIEARASVTMRLW